MSDFDIKQHATGPAFEGRLVSGIAPVNIEGATARFRMRRAPGGATVIDSAAVIVNGATGDVAYHWGAGDTATPGDYLAEFDVTLPGGEKITVPTGGYKTITITPAIAGIPTV